MDDEAEFSRTSYHTVLLEWLAFSSIPQSSESCLTICKPRPWGSLTPGDRKYGSPRPTSVTSTRNRASVRSTQTSKPVAAWTTALVANSDIISSADSRISSGTSLSASPTNRLLAATDVGSRPNERRVITPGGPVSLRGRWPRSLCERWAWRGGSRLSRPSSTPAPSRPGPNCP